MAALPKVQANLLDRAIAVVSPGWAKARLRDRAAIAVAGGYFGGGGRGRRPGLANGNPGAADADADIAPDLADLRGLSRDLARTSPLAGGAISNVVTNVVGTGLAVQPSPDFEFLGITNPEEQKAWINAARREYLLFAESCDCDLTRGQNIYGLQSTGFRSTLESGDIFFIPTMAGPGRPYKLALQMIEADRVCNEGFRADTAGLVQGVELDSHGAPIRYHIANQHPGARQRASMTWTKVDAFSPSGRRNVLHIMDRRRPGQTRGVPYLASVIEPLKQLTRYSEAEVSAAVISAAFAVFVKMDAEAFQSLFDDTNATQYLNSATNARWDGTIPQADMNAPGKAVNLLPGESIESPSLGRPNSEFDPFFMACAKQIGVGLELPVEVILKSFNSSYSAARAALLDAWRFFRGRRDFVATYFCQPVYELWLEEAVALGRIRAPGFFADPAYRRAWSAAVWTGDGPGSIDPMKEVVAARERVAGGISTLAAESLLHDGVDWEVKHRQRVRENDARRRDGLEAEAAAVRPGDLQDDANGNSIFKPTGPRNPTPPRQAHAGAGPEAAATESAANAYRDAAVAEVRRSLTERADGVASLAASVAMIAAREPAAPHIDLHVAPTPAPEVHQHIQHHHHIAAAAAPNVDVHVEAIMPAQAVPQVDVTVEAVMPDAAQSDKPQRMEIVAMPGMVIESMPARTTETTINRSLDGDMTGSTATEKDKE